MRFTGIARPQEFRTVTRAHIIAWRDELARHGLGGSTIRHRLASLASLFEYLCEKNAVTHNPVKGVERPRTESGEGKTPAPQPMRNAAGYRPRIGGPFRESPMSLPRSVEIVSGPAFRFSREHD